MGKRMTRTIRVALSVTGSAILLFSCADKDAGRASASEETMMTEYSEDLSVVMSQNGRRSYHFVTPLLEGYSLAREPYREFRKGVKITTYQNDSLTTVDAVLTANYAIYYENRELWEAKGNVVVEKSDGKTLYTQQLFWNARTKKIYSNVDSKIVQNNGRDVFIGEGFESDEEFKDWRFRRMKGRMEVEMKQSADSAATDSTSVRPVPKPSDSRPSDSRSAVRTSESGRAAPAREIPAGPAERQVGRPEAEVERRPLKMLAAMPPPSAVSENPSVMPGMASARETIIARQAAVPAQRNPRVRRCCRSRSSSLARCLAAANRSAVVRIRDPLLFQPLSQRDFSTVNEIRHLLFPLAHDGSGLRMAQSLKIDEEQRLPVVLVQLCHARSQEPHPLRRLHGFLHQLPGLRFLRQRVQRKAVSRSLFVQQPQGHVPR